MKMLQKFLAFALAFAISMALSGCLAHGGGDASQSSAEIGPGVKPASFHPSSSVDPDVSAALEGFSLDLFKRVEASGKGGNVFLSPLSVWLALCMTYNGASGATADGMAKALHATGILLDKLNGENQGLMGVFAAADDRVQISVANSVWMRKEFQNAISRPFLQTNQTFYGAKVSALDFSSAGAPDILNAWVKQSTKGKIEKVVSSIDPNAVLFLMDAVYFNGKWQHPFNAKWTTGGDFTTEDGKIVRTDYMLSPQYDKKLGSTRDGVCTVRLPYGSGRLEMVAMMPYKEDFDTFLKELTADKIQSCINACDEIESLLRFPKFKLDYDVKLNSVLKDMGMAEAFDPNGADFANMRTDQSKGLYLSDVLHKTYLDVNEAGTEAAGVSVVTVAATAAPQMQLEFTKPFVYLIRDTMTGTILFIGSMEDPAQ